MPGVGWEVKHAARAERPPARLRLQRAAPGDDLDELLVRVAVPRRLRTGRDLDHDQFDRRPAQAPLAHAPRRDRTPVDDGRPHDGPSPSGRHDVGPEPAGQAVDTDQVQAQGLSSSGNGDAEALVGLVNLDLDPDPGWPVRPYLGGGIGAACVSLDTGDGAPLAVDDQAGAFAWNLAAGLSHDLTAHVTLSAGYRYLHLESTDFSASVAGVDTGDIDDVTSHEVLVGLRYTF